MNQSHQIQQIITAYFKDVDNKALSQLIDAFVYDVPNPPQKIGKLIEKFIDDNGLTEAFINAAKDKKDTEKFFKSASMSESSIINDVKMALVSLAYNRFRESLVVDVKINTKNKSNFTYLKREILGLFHCMNRNESYFYGASEDATMVNKIENMTYE